MTTKRDRRIDVRQATICAVLLLIPVALLVLFFVVMAFRTDAHTTAPIVLPDTAASPASQ